MKVYSGELKQVGVGIQFSTNSECKYSVIQIGNSFIQNVRVSGTIASFLEPGMEMKLYVSNHFFSREIQGIKREDGVFFKPTFFGSFFWMLVEIFSIPLLPSLFSFIAIIKFVDKSNHNISMLILGLSILLLWYKSIRHFIECVTIK